MTASTINTVILNPSPTRADIYMTLVSAGTQESGTVVYDSSAVATAAGDGVDTKTCTIESIYCSSSCANTCRLLFYFDASTPVLAFDVPPGQSPVQIDFKRNISVGGLKNTGGAGITGDITLTSTGLASGDAITLVLEMRRN